MLFEKINKLNELWSVIDFNDERETMKVTEEERSRGRIASAEHRMLRTEGRMRGREKSELNKIKIKKKRSYLGKS